MSHLHKRRAYQRRYRTANDYAKPSVSKHLNWLEIVFMLLLVSVVCTVPFLL